ncbi:MAG: hypothetical protein E6Q96_11275 [Cyclobacteriaceae bacterium]|nr:MAG: hypothetical protein E6Q96_11275 [Cyclobacteriaceae bacterium]
MASAFPIQQLPPMEKFHRTEFVFNEDEISNNLLKDNGLTFNYLLESLVKETLENPRDFYMKRKLNELRVMLEKDSVFNSSISQILDNKHFKAIVEFGYEIVPLILEELRYNSSYLVWAMNLITGQKISDQKVSLTEAAKLWIDWGRTNRIIK